MSAWDESDSGSRPPPGTSRPAALLREHANRLLREWELAVRELPSARKLNRPHLVDHLAALLDQIAQAAESAAEGHSGSEPEAHATARLQSGFILAEVLSEYRLLRRCVHRLLAELAQPLAPGELELLDAAIDQAMIRAARVDAIARERPLRELERIFDPALELLELDELLPLLLGVIPDVLPHVDLAVLLLREGKLLKVRGAVGENSEAVRGLTVEIGEGIAGRIAAEKRALTLRFAIMDPVLDRGLMRGMCALYGVPLMYGEELEGVVYMASRSASEFPEHDKVFFRAVCGRATALVVHHRLIARERDSRLEARRSLGQLDALLAASPAGIALLDRELRYIRLNDALAAINNKPVQEHLGRTLREVLPDVAEQVEPLFREILATGRAFTNLDVVFVVPARQRERRWWMANYYPVRLDNGEIVGLCAVLLEVTSRKKAELASRESEERLRLLAEGLEHHAFFMLDAGGRVASWNAGAQRLFGHAAQDVLGQPGALLYPPADAGAGKPEQLLERASREGLVEVAGTRARKDGSTFSADVTLTAVRDGDGVLRGFAQVTRERAAPRERPAE